LCAGAKGKIVFHSDGRLARSDIEPHDCGGWSFGTGGTLSCSAGAGFILKWDQWGQELLGSMTGPGPLVHHTMSNAKFVLTWPSTEVFATYAVLSLVAGCGKSSADALISVPAPPSLLPFACVLMTS